MTKIAQFCACGRLLHYSDKTMEATVQAMSDELGEDITVTVGDRAWSVQRHYIALHGLKAAEISTLGFKEVTDV
jgi:hypothetical protein